MVKTSNVLSMETDNAFANYPSHPMWLLPQAATDRPYVPALRSSQTSLEVYCSENVLPSASRIFLVNRLLQISHHNYLWVRKTASLAEETPRSAHACLLDGAL